MNGTPDGSRPADASVAGSMNIATMIAQVIEEADSARDHHHDQQWPQRRAARGHGQVELADEAGGQRDSRERQEHRRERRRSATASRQEAPYVVQILRLALGTRQHRDDAEGADRRDEVRHQVEA